MPLVSRLRLLFFVAVAPLLLAAISIYGCGTGDNTGGIEPPEKQPAQTEIVIRDVTKETGIDFTYQNGREAKHRSIVESLGGGLAALDYDLDGLYDLVCAGGGKWVKKKPVGLPTLLSRNLGDWKFSTVTDAARITRPVCYTHGCQIADYNNDGFPDLLITGYPAVQLFRNQGDGTFVEVQNEARLNDRTWSSSAAWGDFDNDGAIDLYICHYVNWSFKNHPACDVGEERDVCPPKLFSGMSDSIYFGDGQGGFIDRSKTAGIRNKKWTKSAKGLGVIVCDFDRDNDLDIYVANDTTRNFLFINDGTGKFEEKAILWGVGGDAGGTANGSMGIDVADYDWDGKPDIFVTNYEQESMALYRQDKYGFRHVSGPTGITSNGQLFVGFGTGFIDIELDGDEDIVVANGHVIYHPKNSPMKQKPILLMNNRSEVQRSSQTRFPPATFKPDQYFSTGHVGRGLVLSDFDNNGMVDMAISNNVEPVAILRNETKAQGNWLQVRLVGRASCRDAVGASVVAHMTDGLKFLRVVKGGGSYLSQNDPRLAWGLPKNAKIEKLTVKWPSGKLQIVEMDGINKLHTIIEPAN